MYVDKQEFVKSKAQRHQPTGGFLRPIINPATNLPYKVLDLDRIVRPIEKFFNEQSIKFTFPDPDKGVALDEVMKLASSIKHPFRKYNKGKRNKYGVKVYLTNDNRTNFCSRVLLDYPSQFKKTEHRNIVELVKYMVEPYFESGINLTVDRYYTSVALAFALLNVRITILGTIKVLMLQKVT